MVKKRHDSSQHDMEEPVPGWCVVNSSLKVAERVGGPTLERVGQSADVKASAVHPLAAVQCHLSHCRRRGRNTKREVQSKYNIH